MVTSGSGRGQFDRGLRWTGVWEETGAWKEQGPGHYRILRDTFQNLNRLFTVV